MGALVQAETCAHYLVLDDSVLDRPDGYRYVMSPPLRSPNDQAALWQGLAEGTVVSVGSDDASYWERFKVRGKDDFRQIANGIPGVQARVPILFSSGVLEGRLSLERFVDAVSTQPAKLFGLYPRKGVIAPGSDADLVVYDTKPKWRMTTEAMHTNIEYTCYEEFEITGRPLHVWSRGRRVVDEGQLVGERGWGQFLVRPTSQWIGGKQA
jgi:dihydropyrimidinase